MLTNLRTYLIDNSVNFTTSNVFIDNMPETPKATVMLYRDEGGEMSDAGYVRRSPVVFMIRQSTYILANSWCEEIIDLLHNKQNIDTTIKSCELIGDIVHTGFDEKHYILEFTMEVVTIEG